MAHYHCSYGKCNKGKGSSAAASYDYITRARSYKSKPGLLCFESGNLPDWCEGRAREYWYQADRHERANSNVARKIEFALPAEVTDLELQKELVRDVIAKACNGDRLMWSYAIHTTATGNIHAHVMLSERVQDDVPRTPDLFFKRANKRRPKKGGARKTEFLKTRDFVLFIREQIADLINGVYRRLGIDVSVDHRGYAARGILKVPQAHRGPQLSEMEDRGVESYVLADRREKIVEKQKHLLWDLEFERDGILADLRYLTDQLDLWDRFNDERRIAARPKVSVPVRRPAPVVRNVTPKAPVRRQAPAVRKEIPKPVVPEPAPIKILDRDHRYAVDDELRINVDLPVVGPSSLDDWDEVDGELMSSIDTPSVSAGWDDVDAELWDEPKQAPALTTESTLSNPVVAQTAPCPAEPPSLTPEQLADSQYAGKAVCITMGEYEGVVLAYGEHDLYLRTGKGVIRIPHMDESSVSRERIADYHAIYAPIGESVHVAYDTDGLYPVKDGDDDQSLGY